MKAYVMEELAEKNRFVKYPYSKSSLKKLEGVHPNMVDFAFELAEIIDIRIVSGVRSDTEQHEKFLSGLSSRDGYTKKSNHQPKADGLGYALDMLPLPPGVNMYLEDGFEDNIRWAQFDGACQVLAWSMGIKIKTGFKWRSSLMDSLQRDERANTLPDGNHVELIT